MKTNSEISAARRLRVKIKEIGVPNRIKRIAARERKRHRVHLREGVGYSATCLACQMAQLGMFSESRVYRNRVFYIGGMKQRRDGGCE